MKILHVSPWSYGPTMGGLHVHIKGLSGKLVEFGENVTVFTSNEANEEYFTKPNPKKIYLPREETINGVNIRRFPINYKLFALWKIPGSYRVSKIILKDTAIKLVRHGPFTPRMVWEIIKFKPDIVVGFNIYHPQIYFCYLAKKIAKFPLVLRPVLHIDDKWPEDPRMSMIYKIMKFADLIIVYTDYEKEFLVKKGIDEKKISVIGIGLSLDPLQYNINSDGMAFRNKYKLKNEPIITLVARQVRGKGIETLIDAMRDVWKNTPNARLVLAGAQSSYYPIIKDKIHSLDIEDSQKIILIDDFSEEEKSEIYAACDIFVLPSKVEAFGNVYLEAWIHKKPVIGCKGFAPSFIINNGEDGLLVEYENKKELASAISRLLNNKKMRIELGEKGKEKVLKNYTWDIIANKTRTKYYELVNGKIK